MKINERVRVFNFPKEEKNWYQSLAIERQFSNIINNFRWCCIFWFWKITDDVAANFQCNWMPVASWVLCLKNVWISSRTKKKISFYFQWSWSFVVVQLYGYALCKTLTYSTHFTHILTYCNTILHFDQQNNQV